VPAPVDVRSTPESRRKTLKRFDRLRRKWWCRAQSAAAL